MRPTVTLLRTAWEPTITASVTAVITGHISTELADALDDLGVGWFAPANDAQRC